MLSIEAFSQVISDRVDTRVASESLPVGESLNRISAEQVSAPFNMPEQPKSAMDGYAMIAANWQPGRSFQVSQKVFADTLPEPHKPQTAARIFTGATVPEGADCVVIQENTEALDDRVRVLKKPGCGDNIRPPGSNFRRGQTLLDAGTLINAPGQSLLVMAGQTKIEVRRRIRTALFSLGDELQPPGSELQPGKLYDSNSTMVKSLLEVLGCQVQHRHLPDDRQVISQSIAEAAKHQDLIISSGGASVGERDYVHSIVSDLGDVEAWKVALKPGKPTLFGTISSNGNQAFFFGLPGNPSSTMVTLSMFVRIAIFRLLGLRARIDSYSLMLAPNPGNNYVNSSDRDHLVYCRKEDNALMIDDQQNSASLQSACQATGLCKILAGRQVQGGDQVDYYPFSELFSLPLC